MRLPPRELGRCQAEGIVLGEFPLTISNSTLKRLLSFYNQGVLNYSDQEVYEKVVDATVIVDKKIDTIYRLLLTKLSIIFAISLFTTYLANIWYAALIFVIAWILIVLNAKSREERLSDQLSLVYKWALCQEMISIATQLIMAHDNQFYEREQARYDCSQLSVSLSQIMAKTPVGGPELCLYNHLIAYLHVAQRAQGANNSEVMDRALDDVRLAKLVELTSARAEQYQNAVQGGPMNNLLPSISFIGSSSSADLQINERE